MTLVDFSFARQYFPWPWYIYYALEGATAFNNSPINFTNMLYSTAILALATVASAASIPQARSQKRDLVNDDPQDLGNCPDDGDADACTFEKSVRPPSFERTLSTFH